MIPEADIKLMKRQLWSEERKIAHEVPVSKDIPKVTVGNHQNKRCTKGRKECLKNKINTIFKKNNSKWAFVLYKHILRTESKV